MYNNEDELDDLAEELELLSNPEIRKQIEDSLEAEKKGETVIYSLADFRKVLFLRGK